MIERVRKICLSFPHATEHVQWEALVFKVAGKIFAVAPFEPGEVWLSFKCTPEVYAELLEREGFRPAPYLARAHWVALESYDTLDRRELSQRLRDAYDAVVARLPRKVRESLG